jgi:hypothetical protein
MSEYQHLCLHVGRVKYVPRGESFCEPHRIAEMERKRKEGQG